MLAVEVVYALHGEQVIIALEVEPGATLRQVIERSGLLTRFPEIVLSKNHIGVFGKLCELEEPVQAGDRIEIYRPLAADPKERRRQRARASSRRG